MVPIQIGHIDWGLKHLELYTMAPSHEISDRTARADRRDPRTDSTAPAHQSDSRTQDSGVGRLPFFGRDLPVVAVIAVLAFPAIGAYLGASAGVGSVSAVLTMAAEFGAVVGAVGSNIQSLMAGVGTGPTLAAITVTALAANKITN